MVTLAAPIPLFHLKGRRELLDSGTTYYVYIVRCCDGTLYTGIASDLAARLEKHNQGQGARYTRGRRPVSLVYCESQADKSEALRRERIIKKMDRKAKLSLIAQANPVNLPNE
jgi:putative endonuclease